MTPKEKAIKLVEKMIIYHSPDDKDYEAAKDCALIAVDELIEATSIKYEYNSDFEIRVTGKKPLQYWLDVKTEIEAI
jgi:hypothetical protein